MISTTSISDKTILQNLSKICDFDCKIENDYCTEISFHKISSLFEGTIRKHGEKNKIVKEISKLSCLKFLNLRKCKIGDMPEFRSRNLEYIDISCNDMDILPTWVLKQPFLKFLNVGGNKLHEISDLSHLPLETLKLHKNQIKIMPKIGKKIKSLNLYLNPMSNIPEIVLDLSLLEVFSYGATSTSLVPPLSSLSNLKWLTLTVNQIECLPNDIVKLSKLEGLQLAKNKIKEIPESIGEMNLKSITLYSNEIKQLPNSFFNLKLDKLNLAKNPLKDFQRVKDTFFNIDFLRLE